jgi:WD40 repeat protein
MKSWCLLALLLATASADEPSPSTPLPSGAVARLGAHPMVLRGPVDTLEFTPDGKTLLSLDGDAWLWNATTGELLRRFEVSTSRGALSPDGQTLAIADSSGIHLVDLATGKTSAKFGDRKDGSNVAVWSPDGKWLADAANREIIIWDVVHAKAIQRWSHEAGGVVGLQFSPDGRSLAYATRNPGSTRIRALDGKKEERVLGLAGFDRIVRFSPDGAILAASCDTPTLKGHRSNTRLWDVRTGEMLRDVGSGNAAAFSPDGKMLVISGLGSVRTFDVATGKLVHSLPETNEHVGAVIFSPDGKMLATAHGERIRRWDTATWAEIQPGTGHSEPVRAVAFAPDGLSLATGSLDKTIRIWSWPEGREIRLIDKVGSGWGVEDLAYSPDGRQLCATAWINGRDMFYLYDVETGALVSSFGKDHPGRGRVAFLPDGKEILTTHYHGRLAVWDAATGGWLRDIGQPGEREFKAVQLAPDGRHAFWAGDYQLLGLRDLTTGEDVRVFKARPSQGDLVVSPDGDWVAFGRKFWDTRAGELLSDSSLNYGDQSGATTPDARYLFAGTNVWDLLTRRPTPSPVPLYWREAPAFSPDGTVLAVGTHDGTVVWDMTGLLQNGRLPALTLSTEELESLWQTLGMEDDWAAYRAAWKLAAGGKGAVEFLGTRMKSAEVSDPVQIQSLRQRFTDPDFDVRELAARTLHDLGIELRPEDWQALCRPDVQLMQLSSQPGYRERVEREHKVPLLPPPVLRPLPPRLRSSRAVLALRRSPAPEAAALLEILADGASASPLTLEAKVALRQPAK